MTKQHNDIVEVYEDEGETWRWRKVNNGNHEKLAHSGESFSSQRAAIKAAIRANDGVPVWLVVDKGPGGSIEIDPNEYA